MAKLNKADLAALAALESELKSQGSGGLIHYLKDGDTTVKLVMPEGRSLSDFFETFDKTFNGDTFKYYLVEGVVTELPSGEVDQPRIGYVQVTKTVLLDIINLLKKGWGLFEKEGVQVIITKGKTGGQVKYQTTVSVEEFDINGLEHPEESIDEAAQQAAKSSRDFDKTKATTVKPTNDLEDLPF